ncbi:MAG: heme d1 biosynthesis radical SAM protein NirJ [Thiotrichales bacterium]|nr:MAG: heme d1 biosynthesis radical SAM protein NirJ [Thiotrichales bacterium]
MFRLSQYLHALNDADSANRPQRPARKPTGPVVIWNLIRRCNLTCKHCYATAADKDFPGELDTQQVFDVMDNLKAFGVPVLILSGGEPLMRPDIFEISHRARDMGFYVGLSSNGTLIDENNIDDIVKVGYDYVGISIDGMRETHDYFRRKQGSFDEALRGVRLCHDAGIKVGLRFTLTQDNKQDLPGLLQLMDEEKVDKFYLSHLNYAGRGNKNRRDDLHHKMTREAMDLLFDTCWQDVQSGRRREFVTGNNDADGVYLLLWIRKHMPQYAERLEQMLLRWGGNASGVNIANIDNIGNVHPDTMWWDYTIGNIKQRPFSEIWMDTSDPLMAGLKLDQRPLEGRCAECRYLGICGGNSRTRAWQLTGNFWAEDPGCYLENDEIGVSQDRERLLLTPWSRAKLQREPPVIQGPSDLQA